MRNYSTQSQSAVQSIILVVVLLSIISTTVITMAYVAPNNNYKSLIHHHQRSSLLLTSSSSSSSIQFQHQQRTLSSGLQQRQLHMVASAAASPSMSSGSGSTGKQIKKKKTKQTASSFAIQTLVDNVKFFKKLPWNIERDQKRKSYRLRRDAAQLYRELGIAEDATFEDINDACALLKRKYKSNRKKQIQVDVMKDKIMSLRLEQRMGGLMSATGDARVQSYLTKDAQSYRRKSKLSKTMTGPKWSKGLIQSPKKEWRETCLVLFGFMSTVGFLLNGSAKMMSFLSMIVGVGLMQSRGTNSEYKLGKRGERGGVGMFGRGEIGWHTGQAFVFGLTLFFITYFGAQYITYSTSLQGNPIEFPLVNLICQCTMGIAAMYMQFYKGGKSTKSEDYDE